MGDLNSGSDQWEIQGFSFQEKGSEVQGSGFKSWEVSYEQKAHRQL
jgi:hypothetical protein